MIIDRYIGVTVAAYTALVMGILLSLFTFTAFIGELDDVGKGRYGLWDAAQYVLLIMPRLAYQLFPTVALIGTIVGLGILASSSELIVLRAAGISIARIVGAVMRVGLVLVIIVTILGEVVAPQSERMALQVRNGALSERISLNVSDGMWVRDGRDFVHVGTVLADGSLVDVSVYSLDKRFRLQSVVYAERGYLRGEQWRLENVKKSYISTAGVRTEAAPDQGIGALLGDDLLDVVTVDPEFLSAVGLYQYVNYLQDNDLESERYEQALWRKFFSPLTTAVMVFLAVPFIFGPLRSVAVGQRVLVGTFVGIGFFVVDQGFGYLGLVYKLPPLLLVVAPTAVFFGIAVLLSRRVF